MPSNQSGSGAFFHSFALCGQTPCVPAKGTVPRPWLQPAAGKGAGRTSAFAHRRGAAVGKGETTAALAHIGMAFPRRNAPRPCTVSLCARGRYFSHILCANSNVADGNAFVKWSLGVFTINFQFIYSILYKPCIFKAYRLLNVQTLCIFPCFCPYEPKQGKFLFSADYLIQQSCGSTLRFPCSVSVAAAYIVIY